MLLTGVVYIKLEQLFIFADTTSARTFMTYPATGKTHYGPKFMNYLDVTATKSINDIYISNAKLDEAKILLRSLK